MVPRKTPVRILSRTFFPDGSRLFEEIDRFGISDEGIGCLPTGKADFDFYRALPSGGYAKGRSAGERTDMGDGDIAPEVRGTDFFPYRPPYLRKEPPMAALARLTNVVQRALGSGHYLGAIWLEGSPFVEETIYWLNLLIDTSVPIVGNSPNGRMAPSATTATEISSTPSITSTLVSGRTRMAATVSAPWRFSTSRFLLRATCKKPTRARWLHCHRRTWRDYRQNGPSWIAAVLV